jgi:hypothetical protein
MDQGPEGPGAGLLTWCLITWKVRFDSGDSGVFQLSEVKFGLCKARLS